MRKHYVILLAVLLLGATGVWAQNLTVNTFNGAHHTGANTITETFSFPSNTDNYSQILMHFDLDCPAGGCDPWDRYANIKLVHDGTEYEIGRYVTPYLIEWCDWTLDVTEYRDMLKDSVTLESYVETWQNGWLVNVFFEFVQGTPQYTHTLVENLWVDYFLIYGDTIFYSINLPEQTRTIPDNAQKSVVRIVNTGHGQGNTQNAAEFSNMTHSIWVNGSQAFTQNLWNSDCNVNPCSPQNGTWTFSRAGWCPGQQVEPDDYDITSLVTPGQTVDLDYKLQPYFNQCSPWNPDCINGQTCTECTYNSGSHTQPNYKISAQIIHYSNSPFVSVEEQLQENITVIPNPSAGEFKVNLQLPATEEVKLTVFDLEGKQIHQLNAGPVQSRQIELDLHTQAAGIYLLRVEAGTQTTFKKLILSH
ncbi:MAG: peptide-N-glycosidase F-related protein [Bacteroidota bacterium]